MKNRLGYLLVFIFAATIGCGGGEKIEKGEQKQATVSKKDSNSIDSKIERGELFFFHTRDDLRGTHEDTFLKLLDVDDIEPIRMRDAKTPQNVENKKKMDAAIKKKFGDDYFQRRKKEAVEINRFRSQTAEHKRADEMIKNSKSKVVGQ